jgi:hypothetical protein
MEGHGGDFETETDDEQSSASKSDGLPVEIFAPAAAMASRLIEPVIPKVHAMP